MRQSMPVVRQLYWPGLLVQALAIALLAACLYLALPNVAALWCVLVAAASYMVFCRIMRLLFTSHHRAALREYRKQQFSDAIAHNARSYEFFVAHPWLDRWRFLLLGTASPNRYSTIALVNQAYCESMRGDRAAARTLFEKALHESPGCTNAQFGLQMLDAGRDRTT